MIHCVQSYFFNVARFSFRFSPAPTFRPSGYFRMGTVSPKRSRRTHKPSAEKRRVNYKKGINAHDNRKLRSRLSKNMGIEKKKALMALHRYEGSAKEKMTQDHNPLKLGDVDKTLAKYASNEEKLFLNLTNRYNVNPSVFGVGDSSTPVRSNTTGAFSESLLSSGIQRKFQGSAKEKLIQFYKVRNPLKLGDVDKTLAKYASNEEKLFLNLARRYNVDPSIFGVDESSTAIGSNTTAAFKAYAGTTNTFGSLTSPKAPATGAFGSFSLKAHHRSKGRTSINSLKTYLNAELRVSSDGDDTMKCDCEQIMMD